MRQTLQQARKMAGKTQHEVATIIEISTRHYQDIEAGKREGKGYIWDALETLFKIPQRQLRESAKQSNYTKSSSSGIAKAKALNEAAKKFDVTDIILDVADNGKIDNPANREAAFGIYDALGMVLV